MKKSFLYICLLTITLSVYSQNNLELIGVYGECKDAFHCYQIKLNKDYTFKYKINEYVPGKGIVKGTWKEYNDTLVLDIQLPEKGKPIIKKLFVDTIKGKRIILKTTEKDSLPISNAKVIINDSIVTESDNNGFVCIGMFKIDKIAVSYLNLLTDTIFYISGNEKTNLIEMYIPLSAGTELIYQQPKKWLIEGENLIPFWLTDGKYELRRDRAIKKVPKRKILPELK